MKIADLIGLCERKVVQLQMQRTSADSLGDIEQIERIDSKLNETQNTLMILRSLPE